jgi:hypothetical protein
MAKKKEPGRDLVAMFVDYEAFRVGLWKHFQKRVPGDISIGNLLAALRSVASEIGALYEAYVFGDWTLRSEDAKVIDRTPQFRAQLVLRSDSKKDRTDPVMNFAVDDFFRDRAAINHIVLGACDSDYCEVLRRGNRINKQMYICGVGPQTAPELLSLARAFYPIEQRLGLKALNAEEIAKLIDKVDPTELRKWSPLVKQLEFVERRLPYVVRSHFINHFISPGLGYGDTFEQKAMTLDLAAQLGLVENDRVLNPVNGMLVRTIRLNRKSPMVIAILAA